METATTNGVEFYMSQKLLIKNIKSSKIYYIKH